MPMELYGEIRLRVDGSEAVIRGEGNAVRIYSPWMRRLRRSPKVRLGAIARLAQRLGITIRYALPAGFEVRLGRKSDRNTWMSRLVGGPASMGRAG